MCSENKWARRIRRRAERCARCPKKTARKAAKRNGGKKKVAV